MRAAWVGATRVRCCVTLVLRDEVLKDIHIGRTAAYSASHRVVDPRCFGAQNRLNQGGAQSTTSLMRLPHTTGGVVREVSSELSMRLVVISGHSVNCRRGGLHQMMWMRLGRA
jgi:hypothetical protein